jgi:hypothetical protein
MLRLLYIWQRFIPWNLRHFYDIYECPQCNKLFDRHREHKYTRYPIVHRPHTFPATEEYEAVFLDRMYFYNHVEFSCYDCKEMFATTIKYK